MKKLITRTILKERTYELTEKGKQVTRSTISILMAVTFFMSLVIPAIGTLSGHLTARAQLVCSHVHDEECNTDLNDHECSIETGCEPIHSKTSTIISAGHTHGVDCYITTDGHEHDASCYSEPEEAGETGEGGETGAPALICGIPTDPELALICELEETPDVIVEEIDTDAEPIGWICRYVPELICVHKDCAPDEPCRLEQGLIGAPSVLVGATGKMSLGEVTKFVLTNDDTGEWAAFASLYEAIDDLLNERGNFTITALGDDTLDDTLDDALTITRFVNLTLKSADGEKFTITQDAEERHFTVLGSLTLENIIIEGNGVTTGPDTNGGIEVRPSGALAVNEGAVITKNYSDDGGGIYALGPVSVNGGEISGNSSEKFGGGISASGTVSVNGGKISGNSSDLGGGIYSDNGTDDAITISGGEISGNWSTSNGGGIYSAEEDSTITITDNAKITGNGRNGIAMITTAGGGIFTYGSIRITDSTISSNAATGGGGGISAKWVTIINSTISDNATNGSGGGIQADKSMEIKNSTISGNSSYKGGGIYALGTLDITDSNIIGNVATVYGGGIGSENSTKDAIRISGGEISGNWAAINGGGIYTEVNSSAITITNAQITGNGIDGGPNGDVKTNRGGGIYTYGTLLMENSTVSGNAATVGGGGIYSKNGTTNAMLIDGSVISGNWAVSPQDNLGMGNGGGIEFSGDTGTVTIRNSKIIGNGKDSRGVVTTFNGGGVNSWGFLNIINCTFSDNAAGFSGGGIHMHDVGKLTIDKPPATANSSIFKNNIAAFATKIRAVNQTTYEENIFIDNYNWSFGLETGFNNYDISLLGSSQTATNLGYAYVYFNRNHNDRADWIDADPSVIMVSKGQAIGKMPAEPTRKYNAFEKWVTEADGDTEFDPNTPISENMTVYAKWGPSTDVVKITFDKNHSDTGNNWTEASPQSGDFERYKPLGAKMPKPPTRAGYIFNGWNTKADGSGASVTAATTIKNGDVDYTVYAQWAPGYTVFFHVNHGDTSGFTYPDPKFISVAKGTSIGPGNMPENPTREGYALTGWNTSPNGDGEILTGDSIINKDTDAYAQWTKSGKVTFHIISLDGVAGLTPEDKEWSITTQENKIPTALIPSPSNPSGSVRYHVSYKVASWYTGYDSSTNTFSGKAWDFEKDTFSGDLHLYAFDNVMWDTISAKRAIAHVDFGLVLVRNSFTLTETLNVAKGREVTIRSYGDEEKIITTQGNYRHLNVSGELTQSVYITLTSKDASQNGGGVEVNPGGTFNLDRGKITGNRAESGGGVRSSGIFNMTGGEISGNVATSAGGGIYSSNATAGAIDIDGGSIIGNRTTIEGDNSGQGGGIYSNSGTSTITIKNALITGNGIDSEGNVTTNRGGGVFAFGSLLIENSTISGNAAKQNGGGTYSNVLSTVTTDAVVIDNSVIRDNWTTIIFEDVSSGGGIYAGGQSGAVTIRNGSQIIANGINNKGLTSTNDGGGIFSSLPLEVLDSTVSGNAATRYGGGIRVQGGKATLKIKDSTVSGNVAAFIGGGIHSDHRTDETSVLIDGSTISGNWTTITFSEKGYDHGKGGGMYSVGKVVVTNNSQITGNGKNGSGIASTLYGGGLYSVGALQVANSTISGNSVLTDGGGIYVYYFDRLAIGADVTFSGNTAGNAYWLDAYENTGTYNPDKFFIYSDIRKITVSALKALHGSSAAIKTTSFSAAPNGNAKPFNYLANNYDLNFNGEDVPLLAPHLEFAPYPDFGTGILPTRKTLYGLQGGTGVVGQVNYVENPDAKPVTGLTFMVENPLSKGWSLDLHCTPFMHDSLTGATPVAVGRDRIPLEDAFGGDHTITVYNSAAFAADLGDGKASIAENFGIWNWSRLLYDVKAEAEPGKQVSTVYQSTFTWTLIVSP